MKCKESLRDGGRKCSVEKDWMLRERWKTNKGVKCSFHSTNLKNFQLEGSWNGFEF